MNHSLIKDSNIVLKEIFNSEENLDLLKNFIEIILNIKIKKIIKKNYLKESIQHFYKDSIKEIVNIQVLAETSEIINIGIQIVDGYYAQEKILIYGALMHGMQDSKYGNVMKNRTITINILDIDIFSTLEYHKIINFSDENVVFHVIELPKFKKINIETDEDALIEYLKGNDKEKIENAMRKSVMVNKFDNVIKQYWKNEKL